LPIDIEVGMCYFLLHDAPATLSDRHLTPCGINRLGPSHLCSWGLRRQGFFLKVVSCPNGSPIQSCGMRIGFSIYPLVRSFFGATSKTSAIMLGYGDRTSNDSSD